MDCSNSAPYLPDNHPMVQVIRVMPDGFKHRITVPADAMSYWVAHWMEMRDTRGVMVVSCPSSRPPSLPS